MGYSACAACVKEWIQLGMCVTKDMNSLAHALCINEHDSEPLLDMFNTAWCHRFMRRNGPTEDCYDPVSTLSAAAATEHNIKNFVTIIERCVERGVTLSGVEFPAVTLFCV